MNMYYVSMKTTKMATDFWHEFSGDVWSVVLAPSPLCAWYKLTELLNHLQKLNDLVSYFTLCFCASQIIYLTRMLHVVTLYLVVIFISTVPTLHTANNKLFRRESHTGIKTNSWKIGEKYLIKGQARWCILLISVVERKRQGDCGEFETSLIYIRSFRLVQTIYSETLSQKRKISFKIFSQNNLWYN